jgi:transglutaminase-like putative cysteine protease
MRIRVGFEITYGCPQPTPMILQLNLHPSRAHDLLAPEQLTTDPPVPMTTYRDAFDNICTRVVAPAGRFVVTTDSIVNDSGANDAVALDAQQIPVEELPAETLVYLMGSRYCETDRLAGTAWSLFGNGPTGWGRVQAVCDFVHQHIQFGYHHARRTRTAFEAFEERTGVCRDYAHLGLTLCRCLNIPARYCSGYVTDIGIEPVPTAPMDFAGWFEAYLGGRWYTFDPRNNAPRIGRILMGRGRDACDVPLSNTFGYNTLDGFTVWADEAR